MHSIHTLAHRAPPATRSRVRWQPYNALASATSLSSSSCSRSPSLSYLSTPATSVSSSPPPKATPLCETDRLKAQSSMPQTPRDPSAAAREPPKNKYATGLVDQAVKSLCEIWRPQDIPNVFLTSSRATVGSEIPPQPSLPPKRRNTQLPSPVSPLTQSSPPSPSPPSRSTVTKSLQCEQELSAGNRSNLVPIKGFVHEVLRRSRTSGSVLQTALCYLEAIRPKVPELVRKEQSGEGTYTLPDSECRVMPATAAELALEAQLSSSGFEAAEATSGKSEDVMDTVRVSYEDSGVCTATPSEDPITTNHSQNLIQNQKSTASSNSSSSSSTSPLLPSPLLCPRRAFLASLILASKFTQDKCYSNRAWAKLSGLPAREIGRCERALGDALDWRLWVGKTPVAASAQAAAAASVPVPVPASTPVPAAAPAPATRPVVRCQSEASLALAAAKGSFLRNSERERNSERSAGEKRQRSASPVTARPRMAGLRRASTLPADAFAEKPAAPTPTPSFCVQQQLESQRNQLSYSNILAVQQEQDQYMSSPSDLSQTRSPSTPSSTYSGSSGGSASVQSISAFSFSFSSPIPPTPGLSYSPSSTESSSGGDRTIQMSSFMDDSMMLSASSSSFSSASSSSSSSSSSSTAPYSGSGWVSPTLSGIAFEATMSMCSEQELLHPYGSYSGQAVAAFGGNFSSSAKFPPPPSHHAQGASGYSAPTSAADWPWTNEAADDYTSSAAADFGLGSEYAKFAAAAAGLLSAVSTYPSTIVGLDQPPPPPPLPATAIAVAYSH